MSETEKKAQMAEILANDVFAEFLWERSGPINVSWPCEAVEKHLSPDHPTDVVFFYDEPYAQVRTYVNVDLKSYAKASISASSMKTPIESMCRAVHCAEKSGEWSKRYVHENVSPEVCGLVFVYNHDGEYDKQFSKLLDGVNFDKLDIPPGSKVVVMGPHDVHWINNVRLEIAFMRGGSNLLPGREHCRYYYPNVDRRKKVQLETGRAATLEMLTAPWIVLEYKAIKVGDKAGTALFSRRRGDSEMEFLYMIDYLMHFQRIQPELDIHLRLLNPDPSAAAYFGKAKSTYVERSKGGEEMMAMLGRIQYKSMNNIQTKFSEVELGMGE